MLSGREREHICAVVDDMLGLMPRQVMQRLLGEQWQQAVCNKEIRQWLHSIKRGPNEQSKIIQQIK